MQKITINNLPNFHSVTNFVVLVKSAVDLVPRLEEYYYYYSSFSYHMGG